MTLESANARLVQIFPGVPWRGGVRASNDSGVIKNVDMMTFGIGNEANIII